jgi:hypothetical protein
VMAPTVSLIAASTVSDRAGAAAATIAPAAAAAAKNRVAAARRTEPFVMYNSPMSRNKAPSSQVTAFRFGGILHGCLGPRTTRDRGAVRNEGSVAFSRRTQGRCVDGSIRSVTHDQGARTPGPMEARTSLQALRREGAWNRHGTTQAARYVGYANTTGP